MISSRLYQLISQQQGSLDANVLARHESATDDVRKLLNTIFTEEEPEEPESAQPHQRRRGG